MIEGSDERFRDIRAGDPIPWRERERSLSHHERVPAAWTVQQHAGSDDRVLQAAGPDLVLSAPPPAERIPFVQIEAEGPERAREDAAGRHVEEAAGESHLPRRRERVKHSVVFRRLDLSLTDGTATSASSGEDKVSCRLDRSREGLRFGDVSGNELNRRAEAIRRASGVPRKHPNRTSPSVQQLRDQQPGAPGASDYQNQLAASMELVRSVPP